MQDKKKAGLFAGVIGGIILVIVGTVLLWWNEGNNVRNIRTTNEVEKNVVEITSDSDTAQYAGQLVSLGGKFTVADENVTDDIFKVRVHTAQLERVVEIYQWEEESEQDDDDVNYTYKKVWSEELIDSSHFSESGHDNPNMAPFESEAFCAEKVRLGNYLLSSSQIRQMTADKSRDPSDGEIMVPAGFDFYGKYLINSKDAAKPEIGDCRISWRYNDWKEVSLIAQVSGDSFVAYTSANGKKVNYVTEGTRSAAEMIADMRQQDKIMKWVMRLVGALLIFSGYMSLISPLTKLSSFIPLLGNVINGALVLVIFLIALIQSLLVISIAWFVFRPILGICLLAICGSLGILVSILIKKRKAAAVAA